MELREFVANALLEIVEGVAEAQKRVTDKRAVINPPYEYPKRDRISVQPVSRLVKFDVAVTASKRKDGNAGISVLGSSFGGKLNSEETTVSRIMFEIEVLFPIQKSEQL